MKKQNTFNKGWILLLIPIAILIKYLSSQNSHIVERIYATGIYKLMSSPISFITGVIPVSMAELIILSLVIFIIYSIVSLILKIVNKPREKSKIIIQYISTAAAIGAMVYFSFVILWGVNYHRVAFGDIINLQTQNADTKQLVKLCNSLIDQTNKLRDLVEEDEDGVMKLSSSISDTLKSAHLGYDKASEIYPVLGGRYGRPKGIMLSRVMSYTGIWGVYFPFTFEANVNTNIPQSMIPSTTTHEMAHQRGFAREDEANFIAYITSIMHPSPDFQYSGSLLALMHSMDALAKQDYQSYISLREIYSEGVLRDLAAINKASQQYDGFVNEISAQINNTYLKANAQKDGIQSYGRMVDLLIAYNVKNTNNENE